MSDGTPCALRNKLLPARKSEAPDLPRGACWKTSLRARRWTA
jgi:hypothetical protein